MTKAQFKNYVRGVARLVGQRTYTYGIYALDDFERLQAIFYKDELATLEWDEVNGEPFFKRTLTGYLAGDLIRQAEFGLAAIEAFERYAGHGFRKEMGLEFLLDSED